MIDAQTATKWRNDVANVAATKWRHDVAMGVSPWNRNPHRAISPVGTTGTAASRSHAAPSGLRVRFDLPIHGFAPVATTCSPFGTSVLTPGRYVGAEEVEDDGLPFAEKMQGRNHDHHQRSSLDGFVLRDQRTAVIRIVCSFTRLRGPSLPSTLATAESHSCPTHK